MPSSWEGATHSWCVNFFHAILVASLALLADTASLRGADQAPYVARIGTTKTTGAEKMEALVCEFIADADCSNESLGYATVVLAELNLDRAFATLAAQAARGREHYFSITGYLLDLPGALAKAPLWLRAHRGDGGFDAVASALALRLIWREPALAAAWAREIKDDVKRRFVLSLLE